MSGAAYATGQPLWHGRFGEGPADELLAFTVSLPFDRRLATDDLAGSRAHVRDARARRAARPTRSARSSTPRSIASRRSSPTARSRSRRPTRTSTPRSSAASPRSRAGPAPSCTPAAAATTRSRSTCASTCAARAATRSRASTRCKQVLAARAPTSRPRVALPGLHAPAAGAAGPARAPPARALLGAGARRRPLARLPRRAPTCRRSGAGALAGSSLPLDPDRRRRRARLPAPVRELARRGLRPRLRRRGAVRRDADAAAPLAHRRRDRVVVDRGVRLRPPRRRVRDRLVDAAAEEEPRHRRARARQGGPAHRRPHRLPRDAQGPAARVQPRPAGGQGAVVRRARHVRAVARRARPGCSRRSSSSKNG